MSNTSPAIDTAELTPTFDDEFTSFSSSPDGSVGWMTQYAFSGANRTLSYTHEAEYISDSSVGVNPFSDKNGILDITATVAAPGSNPLNLPYNSGAITTYKSFAQLYGYFEVRADLPTGAGMWPAFWMLPVNGQPGTELDIFEVLGNSPTTLNATTHSSVAGDGLSQALTVANTSTGFHTYGVDWKPTTITFYMDGQVIATAATPPDMNVPMYMLLSYAVGGAGSWPGAPTSNAEFPATMQIDYVHAFATAGTVGMTNPNPPASSVVLPTVTASSTGTSWIGVTVTQYGSTVAPAGVGVALINSAGQVVATGTTSSAGTYVFQNVAAGTYQVRYLPPQSLMLQAGAPANTVTGLTTPVTLGKGQGFYLTHETLVASANLSGSVAYDGQPQAGIAVSLLNSSKTVVATTTTDSHGNFIFYTAAGQYYVQYSAPAGEMAQFGGHADPTTGISPPITLVSGQSFLLTQEQLAPLSATVTGTVDFDGAAQAGITVSLLSSTGATVATTASDAGGAFSFTGLAAGNYRVQYTAPSGEVLQSGPASVGTGMTSQVALSLGNVVSVGAENLAPAPANLTGSALNGSAGQAGVTVTLLNGAGGTVATTTTGANGAFSFTNVAAGNYQVKYTAPSGEALQYGPANTSTGVTDTLTLSPGQTYNLGAELLGASTTGAVTGSAGQAGVTVTLLSGDGTTILRTTTSGAGGAYAFTGLAPAYYRVGFIPPAGEVIQSGGAASTTTDQTVAFSVSAGAIRTIGAVSFAQAPVGTITGSAAFEGAAQGGVTVTLLNGSGGTVATTTTGAGGTFSFANVAAGNYQVRYTAPSGEVLQSGPAGSGTGLTSALTVAAGQTVALGAETLAPAPATISGSAVFAGAAQPGVTVALLNAAGTSTLATTTTNASGAFNFANIAAGSYQLQYTAPSGEVLQSGPAGSGAGLTGALTVAPGQTLALGAETLAPAPATISGSAVFGGAAQPGVTVALLNAAGTSTLATTTTNASGAFSFANIAAGSYQLQYTAPSGEVLQSGPAGSGAGLTGALTVAPGQSLALGAETLAPAPATISGSAVFGGAAQPGVTVALLNAAGTSTLATTTTNASGAFNFANIAAGSYQLQYTAPSGEVLQSGPAGSGAGLTGALTVAPGQTLALGAETLAPAPATISGSAVFGGAAQPGVTVALLNAAGTSTLATTTTNASGAFNFSNIAAGSYRLQYTAPSGEVLQSGPAGSGAGLTGALTVTAGQTLALGAETLIPAPATIAGSALFEGAGQSGVAVTLLGGGGSSTVATTTTDASGDFSFTSLRAGSYEVEYAAPTAEVLQAGPASSSTGMTGTLTVAAGQTLAVGAETLAPAPATITGSAMFGGAGQLGVAVTLLSGDGTSSIATTTTGPGGAFSFANIAAGSYQVQYTAPSGEVLQSGPAGSATGLTGALTVAAGQTLALGAETLIPAPATIAGSALFEGAGQSGVAVTLLGGSGSTVATTTTGAGGAFSFTGLSAGSYEVEYAAPSAEVLQTGPASSSTGLTGPLTVAAGQTLGLAAETLAPAPATITGSAMFGSAGQPGVAVTLLSGDGTSTIATTTTGPGGAFSFANIAAGSYQVQYTAPSGEVLQSGPAGSATGLTGALTVAAGQTLALGAETLIPAPATIAGSALFEGTGQSGVAVTLLGGSGSTVATTTTGAGGAFSFTGLSAGSYEVEYAAPSAEVLQTGPASSSTGLTSPLTVAAGQTLGLAAETLAPAPATITGSAVFGGVAQSGVTVALLNAAGTSTLATATTDVNGDFSFANIAAGSYQLQYTAPSGEVLKSGPIGSGSGTGSGLTGTLTVAPGQTLAVAPETLAPAPAAISGSVLFAGAGQSGVAVALLSAGGGTITTTTSDANGDFSFTGLAAGTYALRYTIPSSEMLQAGDPANTTTGVTANFAVAAGQSFAAPAEDLLLAPINLTMNGSHTVVNPGSGVFIVTGSPGAGSLVLGNGNQSVDLGGYGTNVTLGNGNDSVTFTGTLQTLHAGNGAETISLTGNFDSVSFGNTPAGATSTVAVNGVGDTITGGAGNVAVTGSAGSAMVTLGSGNDTVSFIGSKNSITVGSGTSVINAGTNGEVVHTAGGSATVTVGGESNLVDVGAGSNVINAGSASRLDSFMLNGSGQGLTTINGFTVGTGDVLDLTRTLSGVNIAADMSNLGQYITASVSNGSTTLSVDPTGGSGTPYAFVSLQNVSTSVGALIAGHSFKIG